jgi:hypothetical protein
MSITNSDTLHRTGTSKVSITNLILNTFNAEVQHIINYSLLPEIFKMIDLRFTLLTYVRLTLASGPCISMTDLRLVVYT